MILSHCERKRSNLMMAAIYILTNKRNGVLYTGVTSNLVQRIWQHKNSATKGFSYKYKCKNLVYFEVFDNINYAITREKQIKAGSRTKKLELINSLNPDWKDLYSEII